jgi:hypothetical protein
MTDIDDNRSIVVKQLLAACRQKIREGDGHQALAVVLDAVILIILTNYSSNYNNIDSNDERWISNIRSNNNNSYYYHYYYKILDAAKREADQVSDLQEAKNELDLAKKICFDLLSQETILSERGEEDILVDAFKDGSSVVCKKCNSLIPAKRAEAHRLYWCE